MFGDPIELEGMVVAKIGDIVDGNGERYSFKNQVIIDGCIPHTLTNNDEIELPFIGRVPIQVVAAYNSLRPGCELLEVYC